MIDFLEPPQIKFILKLPLEEGSSLIEHFMLDHYWVLVFRTMEDEIRIFRINLEENTYEEIVDVPRIH